jgi:hypothetical protein
MSWNIDEVLDDAEARGVGGRLDGPFQGWMLLDDPHRLEHDGPVAVEEADAIREWYDGYQRVKLTSSVLVLGEGEVPRSHAQIEIVGADRLLLEPRRPARWRRWLRAFVEGARHMA